MNESRRSPGGDDPIRRLREEYAERMRIYERRDKIEARLLAVFLWFYISFWSLGLYEIAFGDWHVTFRTTQGFLEVLGAAGCGLLVTVVAWPVLDALVAREEAGGLLSWWDDRRKRR